MLFLNFCILWGLVNFIKNKTIFLYDPNFTGLRNTIVSLLKETLKQNSPIDRSFLRVYISSLDYGFIVTIYNGLNIAMSY
jgi:hypothetical protein